MACSKCINGIQTLGPLGLKVKCSCVIESPVKTNSQADAEKPVYHVTGAQRELAVQRKLIPESRQNDEYDEQFIKSRISALCEEQKCKVRDFDKYSDVLKEIITNISTNTFNKSYLIGAPNGFGKTTFANTCIKRLDAMGKKAAPYISLFELGELRVAHEKLLLGYIDNSKNNREKLKEFEIADKEYNWTDYMQASVLFTFFTAIENKKVEAKILKMIMDIRGTKGLPTVVFLSSTINIYINDAEMKRYIWDDILAYNDVGAAPDRLMHRSCYKIYNSIIQAKRGEDY